MIEMSYVLLIGLGIRDMGLGLRRTWLIILDVFCLLFNKDVICMPQLSKHVQIIKSVMSY